MDPTSAEESTPWDPITGKLRAHSGLKLPRGTREALAKHTRTFGDGDGFSAASTRAPTTAATSAATTAPGTPRRHSIADYDDLADMTRPLRGNDDTQPLRSNLRQSASQPQMKRATSVPRPPGATSTACGSGKRAVRFLAEQQRSPSRDRLPAAMQLDPGRYDVDPSPTRVRRRETSSERRRETSSERKREEFRRDDMPRAMRADPARYDVAPRGSTAAREAEAEARHVMHMKADPRNDMLNDGSGHNADGDGQTMMGIEVKQRFSDMRTAFLSIDTDHDGRITARELMEACMNWNIPLSEAERVMNCTDIDQKGFIDFDEFARRFNPYLEVSEDDDEILRLYQEGIMANEQPIKLAGMHHGTSTAEPLVDEASEYRTDNADLRGRLARAMRRVSDLETDLKASRAHAASLEASLKEEKLYSAELQGRNAELEGHNAELRRKLADAEDDRRRAEEREKRMARLLDNLEDEQRRKLQRHDDEEEERRRNRAKRLSEEEEAERARLRRLELDLEEADAERRRREQEEERNTVFVYGVEGCEKTQALCQALKKAKVPFKMRDFHKDKRFLEAVEQSEDYDGCPVYAPVVCLDGKAWWQNHEEAQMIPFPQAVAMELRHLLGLNEPKPEKVRMDVDIDQEIFARFLSMQDAFLKIDDDRDGFISEEELMLKCKEWNIPTSEAARVIAEADRDNKGCLDFDEFAKRFSSIFNRGALGPLKTIARMPHQPRPKTSPPAAS
eukprot:TRINITY_DN599_c0_g1_i1.p1 TRINITY_DN599_c0_g1~~TRINITY_DN599_c0_g1_i1.p1  ORF type:complete len:750 (-),score=180.41 TRINITY_DN599_c0_g1_i1:65-2266(-)